MTEVTTDEDLLTTQETAHEDLLITKVTRRDNIIITILDNIDDHGNKTDDTSCKKSNTSGRLFVF